MDVFGYTMYLNQRRRMTTPIWSLPLLLFTTRRHLPQADPQGILPGHSRKHSNILDSIVRFTPTVPTSWAKHHSNTQQASNRERLKSLNIPKYTPRTVEEKFIQMFSRRIFTMTDAELHPCFLFILLLHLKKRLLRSYIFHLSHPWLLPNCRVEGHLQGMEPRAVREGFPSIDGGLKLKPGLPLTVSQFSQALSCYDQR